YEQFPIETGLSNTEATFVTREAGLASARQLLNEARDALIATPASAEFDSDVRRARRDLGNSIEWPVARRAASAGELQPSSTGGGRVSPGATSEFRFSAADGNPIFNIMYRSGNAWQMRPEQTFRLEAEPGDERVGYFVIAANVPGFVAPMDSLASYSPTANPPIPVYTYDEIRLIQAEVFARNGQLGPARDLINEVRTQCAPPGTDPTDPMPCL